MINSKYQPGKHFLQLPGPSNVPDRILRAMDYPTIDHRGPDFQVLTKVGLNDPPSICQVQPGLLFSLPWSTIEFDGLAVSWLHAVGV